MIGLKEKNKKRGKIQAKKKLGMEKEREITIAKIKYRAWNGDKERNEILKSYLRERSEGKSGFVSHTKLTAEATFMDLFHS